MVDINRIEDNKIMASFMHYTIKEGVSYYTDENDEFINEEEVDCPVLRFHTSYEWLMKVVEHIEELGYDVGIYGTTCVIHHITGHLAVDVIERDTKFEAIYETCLQFIKDYEKR